MTSFFPVHTKVKNEKYHIKKTCLNEWVYHIINERLQTFTLFQNAIKADMASTVHRGVVIVKTMRRVGLQVERVLQDAGQGTKAIHAKQVHDIHVYYWMNSNVKINWPGPGNTLFDHLHSINR